MPAVRLSIEESPRFRDVASSATPFRVSTNRFWLPVTSLELGAAPNHMSRDDEVTGVNAMRPKVLDGYAPRGGGGIRAYPNPMVPLLLMSGLQPDVGFPAQGNGTNEVQLLTRGGTITGGTWTLTWTPPGGSPETTDAMPATADAALVQAFIERLPSVTPGDIVVSGGPLTAANITLTFQGQYAARDVAQVTVSAASLTGTTPTLTPSTTTPGAPGTVLDPDGNGATAGVWVWRFVARNSPLGARTRSEPITAQVDAIYDAGPSLFGQGMAVGSLAWSGDAALTVDMTGLYVDRYLAEPGLNPSYDAETVLPLLPRDLGVTWLAGGGPVSGVSWTLTNGLETTRDMGRPTREAPGRIWLTTPSALRGQVDSSQFAAAEWDSLLSAGQFAFTQRWRSPSKIGATGVNYRAWVEAPACQIVGGGPEALGQRIRHGAAWDWEANLSQAVGYAHRITLTTAVAAAETYV